MERERERERESVCACVRVCICMRACAYVRACVCVCMCFVVVVNVGDLLFLISLLNETKNNPGQAVIVLWPSFGFKRVSYPSSVTAGKLSSVLSVDTLHILTATCAAAARNVCVGGIPLQRCPSGYCCHAYGIQLHAAHRHQSNE